MWQMWRRYLAWSRLSWAAICEESRDGRDGRDYHDYRDESEWAPPMHDYVYHCSRCGKAFTI
jgi:hypothetical protein